MADERLVDIHLLHKDIYTAAVVSQPLDTLATPWLANLPSPPPFQGTRHTDLDSGNNEVK